MTALIVIVVIVVLLAIIAAVFFMMGRRDTSRAVGTLSGETKARDRQGRSNELVKQQTAVQTWQPPTPEEVGASRRQFLNRGIWGLTGLAVVGTGAGVLSFLWPKVSGGFGSKISLGSVGDLKKQISAGNGFFYVPEGKLFVTDFPIEDLPKAKKVYSAPELSVMQEGLCVTYQKCPHLGCRVPPCYTSQWFECPCHGSQYNQVGEKKSGPAPRGMDRFACTVSGGVVTADTGAVIQGPPIGTDTTGQEPAGPHCVSGGE